MAEKQLPSRKPETVSLRQFLLAFLMPTLIGKSLILYFGIHYSNEPGEGYGYGLVATICFTLLGLFRLVWKMRNVDFS